MYWLRRPPYLRWIAATAVLALGFAYDNRPQPVTLYPFVADPVSLGQEVDASIEWREIPAGVLPEWIGEAAGIATADLPPGTPLVPELVTETSIPAGWWTVPLEVAYPVAPGTRIRVGLDGGVAEGITAGAVDDTGYSLTVPVAFSAEDAATVASANSALVVMVGAEESASEPGG